MNPWMDIFHINLYCLFEKTKNKLKKRPRMVHYFKKDRAERKDEKKPLKNVEILNYRFDVSASVFRFGEFLPFWP